MDYCVWCGRPRELCASEHCGRCAPALDPPRFCPHCGRTLVVLITPRRVAPRCRDHGPVDVPLPEVPT